MRILHYISMSMIRAIEDINAIIKELAVIRLKSEGCVDGQVTEGIADSIVQANGKRMLMLWKEIILVLNLLRIILNKIQGFAQSQALRESLFCHQENL